MVNSNNCKRLFYQLMKYRTQNDELTVPVEYYNVFDTTVLKNRLTSIEENTAYIINLEILDIPFSDFQKIFYPTFNEFLPSKNLYHTSLYRYINNTNRKVIKFSDDNSSYHAYQFNLYNEIIKTYEFFLDVKSEYWRPDSLIKLQKKLAKINNLLDAFSYCNIDSTSTFEDFILRAIHNGISIELSNNNDWKLIDKNNGDCSSVIIASVTCLFESMTTDVPDIYINWPFKIVWDEIKCLPKKINLKKIYNTVYTQNTDKQILTNDICIQTSGSMDSVVTCDNRTNINSASLVKITYVIDKLAELDQAILAAEAAKDEAISAKNDAIAARDDTIATKNIAKTVINNAKEDAITAINEGEIAIEDAENQGKNAIEDAKEDAISDIDEEKEKCNK